MPAGAAGLAASRPAGGRRAPCKTAGVYGLIGKMIAGPGQRDALVELLLEGSGEMPGCRSYVVARDPADDDAIWVTEVWDDESSHRASLDLPEVQAAIAKARPIIAGFGDQQVTEPVGGVGIDA